MMRRSEHRGAELPSQTSDVLVRYAGAIGETITVTGTITRKEKVLGRRYSTVSTLLEVNCGTSIVTLFSTARWATAATVGDQITVTGTVTKHQYWRGTPQTQLGGPPASTTQRPPPPTTISASGTAGPPVRRQSAAGFRTTRTRLLRPGRPLQPLQPSADSHDED